MADADPRQNLERSAAALLSARSVVVFTGAGVSAESGVPTFRGNDGLWEGHSIEEVASIGGWHRDPVKVWNFYQARRENLLRVSPNPGHAALAELEREVSDFVLVTQNVDGLHREAGSKCLIELHGNMWRVKCTRCDHLAEDRTHPFKKLPPECPACGGVLRPDIVWFGEAVPLYEEALRRMDGCDVFLTVGTSAVVYPAAGLIHEALSNGAFVIEVNPDETPVSGYVSASLRGPSGRILPQLIEQLKEMKKS